MISYRQMYDFANGQVEWYKKQIEWYKKQNEFCNGQLKRCRKEDRDLCEYALTHNPTEFSRRVFGKDYVGEETRKYMNERARNYRMIKRYEKEVKHFEKESAYYEQFIG